jgi:hypothetical protein
MGSFLLFGWGIAHLFPAKSVVEGFGDISADNRHIITMEWTIEGLALIFMGVIVAFVTYLGRTSVISKMVYRISFLMLIALAWVSLRTGFRVNFLPFKLCPIIFTVSAVLIILGRYI